MADPPTTDPRLRQQEEGMAGVEGGGDGGTANNADDNSHTGSRSNQRRRNEPGDESGGVAAADYHSWLPEDMHYVKGAAVGPSDSMLLDTTANGRQPQLLLPPQHQHQARTLPLSNHDHNNTSVVGVVPVAEARAVVKDEPARGLSDPHCLPDTRTKGGKWLCIGLMFIIGAVAITSILCISGICNDDANDGDVPTPTILIDQQQQSLGGGGGTNQAAAAPTPAEAVPTMISWAATGQPQPPTAAAPTSVDMPMEVGHAPSSEDIIITPNRNTTANATDDANATNTNAADAGSTDSSNATNVTNTNSNSNSNTNNDDTNSYSYSHSNSYSHTNSHTNSHNSTCTGTCSSSSSSSGSSSYSSSTSTSITHNHNN